MQSDRAELIGVSALLFLAGDTDRLVRFLTLTGLGPAELRAEARSPRILAAVLEHLLQDESLLLVFCVLTACRRRTSLRRGARWSRSPARSTIPSSALDGIGRWRTAFALAFLEESELLQFAADGEVAVVDIEP